MQRHAWLWIVLSALACDRGTGTSLAPAADAGPTPDAPSSSHDAAAAKPDASADPIGSPDAAAADVLPAATCSGSLPARLRRLTSAHYVRAVRELTGVTVATPFPAETTIDGFEDRSELGLRPPTVAAWNQAAREVVEAVAPRLPALVGCAGPIDDRCARDFIQRFGRRAYRRPLAPAELDAHVGLFQRVRDLGDGSDGILAVLQLMLQSPHFVLRPELGGQVAGSLIVPTPWEVATRLSFFLWGNMPDAALLDAAQAGVLSTPAEVTTQARRMLLDARARQGGNDFFRQFLGLEDVLTATKDLGAVRVPDWRSLVAPALREEGYRFTQRVLFDGDGKFGSLFTSAEGIVNGPLAQLYGLTITGSDWQPVDLTNKPRRGLLTQGWFLASRARDIDSNPVTRGLFVRQRLLCQPVPAPPPDEPPPGPPPGPDATTRERLQAHLQNPACTSCHQLLDPLGFPFESYDGVAVFRATEKGKPIDSSGAISGTDVDGPVRDALALSQRLATSAVARNCLAERWYQLGVGREKNEGDDCRLNELQRRFKASDGDLRQLLVDIVTQVALAPRPASEVGPPAAGQPLLTNPAVASRMVLDLVGSQLAQLRQRLTHPGDRLLLEVHLEGVRELERRLQ